MKALRQYEAEIHGQLVTVTVLPPGTAQGICRDFQSNVHCKGYKYGGQKPKRKRRKDRRKFVPVGRINPLVSQEVQ